MSPKEHLASAAKNPFDETDAWHEAETPPAPAPAKDFAHAAARGVIRSLQDRHTIKHSLEGVHEEVRKEIVDEIAAIIRQAHIIDRSGT